MAKGIMEATYGKFGQNIMIVQWSSVDDMIVFMDMADGYYYRVRFFMTGDDTIEMGEKMWVKPRFLTEEEIDMVFPETPEERAELDAEIEKAKEDLANATAAEIPGDEEVKVEEPVAEVVEEKVEAVLPEAEQPVVAAEPEPVVEAPVEAPVVEVVPEVEEKADDEKKAEGIFISESERLEIENDRQELANYRKEKKLAIIEKYSEYLNTDEKLMFSQKVDKYNFENLEAELAKISMEKVLKQNQATNVASAFGFRTAPKLQNKPNSDELASLVERYKGK
jgi:hypothetical protein